MRPRKYAFGPHNAELLVHTRRTGAAAAAGHDLVIEVGAWSGTVEVGTEPGEVEIELTADGGSLHVREGKGGMQALGDDDKANIEQTIDEEVLKRTPIAYRSDESRVDGDRIRVRGPLELAGRTRAIEFELRLTDDGHVSGDAIVSQSEWGIKPYSALFGTLKVPDEVRVTIDGTSNGSE
jgi:hypothetical protein